MTKIMGQIQQIHFELVKLLLSLVYYEKVLKNKKNYTENILETRIGNFPEKCRTYQLYVRM